jgi:hypothetical protein
VDSAVLKQIEGKGGVMALTAKLLAFADADGVKTVDLTKATPLPAPNACQQASPTRTRASVRHPRARTGKVPSGADWWGDARHR